MEALQPPMDATRRTNDSSSSSSSPEFEFWVTGNLPSLPAPDSLTADELFLDGLLLPLHLLSLPRPRPQPLEPSIPTPPSTSKRWKDIFKVGDKDKNKDRKTTTSADLNINIWPFSRSRSAATHPRPAPASARKASSAPCSRSSSRGESASKHMTPPPPARRWAPSPGRNGVHLGRSSPVWQPRRVTTKAGEPTQTKERAAGRRRATGARLLSLNVNTCIGYRNQVSCRDDDGGGGGNGSLFGLKTLFSKKVH